MYKLIMLFVYYPCNSIQAPHMGCIDAPHPHIICRYPIEIYRCTGEHRGHSDIWGHPNVWGVYRCPLSVTTPHSYLKSRNTLFKAKFLHLKSCKSLVQFYINLLYRYTCLHTHIHIYIRTCLWTSTSITEIIR